MRLCFGEEKLVEQLGSVLGTGDGMSNSPLILKDLVIVSTHVSLLVSYELNWVYFN
jgi:hypothetical protein